jgi:hypothetical protein
MLIAFAAIVVTRIAALPRTAWEFDELLFMMGARHFDPIAHHPPPPGYPLFMFVARLMRTFFASDFAAFVALNFFATLLGFIFLALAFRNISGSEEIGIGGSLLFWMSPVMLVHSTTAFSDAGGIALFSIALWSATRDGDRHAVVFAVAAAAAVGWRPQLAIAIVPMLVAVVLLQRWRQRAIIVSVFTLGCLAWLIPLMVAVGGAAKLLAYEAGQAGYLAEHDAALSRSNWSAIAVAVRFIAQSWGASVMSIPLLAAAIAGIVATARARDRRAIPLAIAFGVYLSVALTVMDPADGTRYSLPATLAVAFFAARGLPAYRYAIVALFSLASLTFVSSILSQRATSASPPVQAAEFARAAFPANAVALYELPLWPHAQYFLAAHHPMRIDPGLSAYFDRRDVPLYIFADGATRAPGARTFRWQASEAYATLTRNHYRVISIIPLPPERRFKPLRGMHSLEREPEGEGWRWLMPLAELQLPSLPATKLDLRLAVPPTVPFDANDVAISIDGRRAQTVRIARGTTVTLSVPLARAGAIVRFESARSFIPAEVAGSTNRDPRRLAVRLLDLVLR